MCVCVCVCVCVRACVRVCACNPLKEQVVANSALDVVIVSSRDAPKLQFWAETENSGCARSKTKTENAL